MARGSQGPTWIVQLAPLSSITLNWWFPAGKNVVPLPALLLGPAQPDWALSKMAKSPYGSPIDDPSGQVLDQLNLSPTGVENVAISVSPVPEKSFTTGGPDEVVVVGGGFTPATVTVTVETAVVVTVVVTVFAGWVTVIGAAAWITVLVSVRARAAQIRVLPRVKH
jgi:hypothetical protein